MNMQDRVRICVQEMEMVLGTTLVKHFPEVKTGDYDGDIDSSLEEFVKRWLYLNHDSEEELQKISRRLQMKPEIAQALEESIKHWEHNLFLAEHDQFDDIHYHSDDCALCRVFSTPEGTVTCTGCPVAEATEAILCRKSPWMNFVAALHGLEDSGYNGDYTERAAEAINAIKNEIEFLKSLRD